VSDPTAAVRDAIAQAVADSGVDLEDVEISSAGKRRVVRVIVDADNGVDLDAVAAVSRAVSERLDATEVLADGPYTLEVTSPGINRPLQTQRHWARAHDRLVNVTFADGSSPLTGRVRDAESESATLDTPDGPAVVRYADVAKAVVQVEFNRKPPKGS